MIEIGKIINTHALKGEMRFDMWHDDAKDLKKLEKIYIGSEEYKLSSIKPHKNMFLIKLEGVETIEEAERFKNKVVKAKKDDLPEPPEGTYYIKDLIGMEAYEDNRFVGTLKDCFQTGSNDVYVIELENKKELLLPAIKDAIKNIDVAEKRMDIVILEGLLD